MVIYRWKFIKKRLWSLLFFPETPATAVIFLQITGDFAIFFPPTRRYRRKISAKIYTRNVLIVINADNLAAETQWVSWEPDSLTN